MKLAALAAAVSLALSTGTALADDAPASRVALLPLVGVGFAHVSKSDVFPNNVGTTSLGLELDAQIAELGGLLRAQFLSSGQDGRWTGMSYAVGGSYRLFGDGFDSLSLITRAGLDYEHWRASTGGCDVMLFVPNNCKDFTPPPGSGVVNPPPPSVHLGFDAIGVFGGVRLELPVRGFYVAFDAEVAPLLELGDASGPMLQFRAGLVLALRHRRQKSGGVVDPTYTPRPGRGGTF